jgi:hypothetical protein
MAKGIHAKRRKFPSTKHPASFLSFSFYLEGSLQPPLTTQPFLEVAGIITAMTRPPNAHSHMSDLPQPSLIHSPYHSQVLLLSHLINRWKQHISFESCPGPSC